MTQDQPRLGFAVSYQLDSKLSVAEQSAVNTSFLQQALAANGLFVHGGGRNDFVGFANAEYPTSATEEQRQAVVSWLAAHPGVRDYQVGPLEVEPDTV